MLGLLRRGIARQSALRATRLASAPLRSYNGYTQMQVPRGIDSDTRALLDLMEGMEMAPRTTSRPRPSSSTHLRINESKTLTKPQISEMFSSLKHFLPDFSEHIPIMPPVAAQLCAAVLLQKGDSVEQLWNALAETKITAFNGVRIEPLGRTAAHLMYEHMTAYALSMGRFDQVHAILKEMTSPNYNMQPTLTIYTMAFVAARLFKDRPVFRDDINSMLQQIWRSRVEYALYASTVEQRISLLSLAVVVCADSDFASSLDHAMLLVKGFEVQLPWQPLQSLVGALGRRGDYSKFTLQVLSQRPKERLQEVLTEDVLVKFIEDATQVSTSELGTFIESLLDLKSSTVPTEKILSTALFAAAKAADFELAEYIFGILETPGFYMEQFNSALPWKLENKHWSALFKAAIRRDANTALPVLHRMKQRGVVPPKGVYEAMIEYFGEVEDPNSLIKVVGQIPKKLLASTTLQKILTILAGWNQYQLAAAAIESSESDPNVQSYTVLMEMFYRLGQSQMVVKVFRDMRKRGGKPSVGMYCKLLRVIGIREGPAAIHHIMELFHKDGHQLDVAIWGQLFELAAIRRRPDEALGYLRRMTKLRVLPDAHCLNQAMRCFLKSQNVDNSFALEFYKAHIEPRRDLKWSPALFHSILSLFVQRSELDRATNAVVTYRSQGGEPNNLAYAMILNAYAGKGDAPKTFALLAKFEQQGLVIDKAHITTVLLEALLKSSQFEANMMKRKRSRHLFTRFEENPYASMTSVERCRAGWVLWANMRRHGIVPLGKTFMNMLRLSTTLEDVQQLLSELVQILPEQMVSLNRELYITKRFFHVFAEWILDHGSSLASYSAFSRVSKEAETWLLPEGVHGSREYASDNETKMFIRDLSSWLQIMSAPHV